MGDRPEVHRFLGELRPGDVLVVWKLDRLSLSLKDLLHLLEGLNERGAGFQSITEQIDTTTPKGRMMLHMVGAFVEFEYEMIRAGGFYVASRVQSAQCPRWVTRPRSARRAGTGLQLHQGCSGSHAQRSRVANPPVVSMPGWPTHEVSPLHSGMRIQTAHQLNRTMNRLRAAVQQAERHALEAAGRADDAEYLANLSLELDATNDPRVISEHVAGRLRQLVHADQICISFGTVLRGVQIAVLHGEGPPQFEAFRHQRFHRAEDGVLWERIDSGEALFVDDYARSPTTSPFMLQAGVRAVAHLPFGRLDGEVGVLTAFRFSARPAWTAQERTLLEATGRTLGHAMQRAQQILELDQAMRFSKAIAQVARLTERPLSLYETARQAAEIMAGPARLDFAALAQVDGENVSHRVQFRSAAVSESAELVRLIEQGLPKAHSLAWRCLQQNEALFIDQFPDIPERVEALMKEDVRALAFVPLTAGDPARGLALIIGRVGDSLPWSDDDRELFMTAAQSVRLSHERQDSMDRLRDAALTDPLTRLGNRRALENALELALEEAGRRCSGLSVISLDLDGLKAVNDREGHDRGDALLAGFAASLQFAFRGEDTLFRVGGDEFVVIVKHPAPAGAALSGSLARIQVALNRLRETGFEHSDVSAGMATFPEDRTEGRELLRLSDQRMYLQKQKHRTAPRI